MRSKRLFAMLLAVVMVLSVFSPVAHAVKFGEDTAVSGNKAEVVETNKIESSAFNNSLIVNPDGKINSLRDNDKLNVDVQEIETAKGEGSWIATEVDKNLNLIMAEEPDCIAELKEAAELFAKDEKVAAFVVMENAPLAETYSSISRATLADKEKLLGVQNKVIEKIEKTVLAGADLNVRYQFTYLTNAFTIETEFANLEKIAKLDGVKSVFVMPVYEPCTTSDPNTAASGAMTGVHTVWEELGYTGAGMKIAIIDTGLDLDHPSFAADPELTETSMTVEDIDAVLENLNAFARRGTITGKTLYRSAKVPFAFNYVDENLKADHSADMQGDHGTHVAGIAAANALETTSVVGMAPDAQIIVMKVFGAAGGAYTDDIVAALEDAMTLGCDVVNASLGSPAGFSSTDTEIDLIYQRLADQDIIATISAGNEGTSSYDNMWGTNLNRTQNPDNAAIGSPSIYANTFSIASAENSEVQTPYFTLGDGTRVFFNNDTYGFYFGYTPGMAPLINEELEYVVIDGLGNEEDYYDAEGNSLVEGKIAVVYRGEINFGVKIFNAEMAGAVGCIIANNVSDDIFNFMMNDSLTDAEGNEFYASIPTCLISMEDGAVMAACEAKTLTVAENTAARMVEGGQMSSFSSWGVSPDLRLVPDITGIGGNVYSCYDGGNYGLMSGTSMSAPQIAGVSALVMQHLYTIYPDAPDGTVRELAMAMMMSTADPIISSASGVEASPRQQGAGLIDAHEAVTSEVYLTVAGNRPKVELGDSSSGVFKFSFEIHNIGEEDKTYNLSASLLTEAIASAYGEYFMLGMEMELSGDVTFDQETVTVPAGGETVVNATITLSEQDKALFAAAWENGGYVEGYVYLANEEGEVELNLPYLGFYGDWTEAPVFDSAYWYDNSFWGAYPENGLPEGDEYYHVIWTDLLGTDWVLGFNPYYGGPYLDQNYNIVYDPANNVLSPNGDGVLDGIDEIYLSLLRNAKTLTFTYTIDGEIVHRETTTNNSKTMYRSSYVQVVPWIYSWYGYGPYDFKGLETGTEVLLTIDATVDYGTGGDHSIQIPFVIDVTKPELHGFEEMENAWDSQILGVKVSDETALAGVYLMNPAGTQTYGVAYDGFAGDGCLYDMYETADGSYVVFFDVTGLGNEFTVAVCDYGGNESYYNVEYTSNGDNAPDMSEFADQIFAYRVYDDHLMSDHMYGWVSMGKPAEGENAFIGVWTDDYLEYAAINAAEYVGGKIFAVDAVYNLVVIQPGVWNRSTICNLGVNVLDMTFDDSTDTMYVLTKTDDYVDLYTMDLMTGELELLKEYGYYSYAPWAITDDDNGTIYAIQYNKSNLFTLDEEYNMVAVTTMVDEVETELTINDSTGSAVKPSYGQSMTYADGKIYWAYFKNQYNWYFASELICIDTADWTYTAHPYASMAYDYNDELVEYYPVTEMVGLLTLTETDYTLPEAEALVGLVMSADSMLMKTGETDNLTATAIPWNYELGELTWSSSDETVVTVSGGEVTAVGEGSATITVTCGEGENAVSASCEITVIDMNTSFYAYNYYSADGNYGYMVEVDMGDLSYGPVAVSPVDFIAGDYNGHDGYFYGYSEAGQLYRYDINNDEAVKLGDPISILPADMAYDYSTGTMYFTTASYMGPSGLYTVSMANGEIQKLAEAYMPMMTIACDGDGNLYSMIADGTLVQLFAMEGYLEMMPIMEGLGELSYSQTMCWDHDKDVLLWSYAEAGTVICMNPDPENPYALPLGDPTGSGLFQFIGMFTIPETIMELPYVAVESAEAADITVLTGTTSFPKLSVYPFNATNQAPELTSADPAIAVVNADGSITGVAEGTTVITGTLTDGETVFDIEFAVTVMDGADDLYGHVMTDLATLGGQYWLRIYPQDTGNPDNLEFTDYVIYAEEYYNGNLYAVGYDPNNWEGNWQMFVMDPVNHTVYEQSDLGEGYPFVYDMTYDYATSTMYCMAGPSDNDADLYAFDMETGALTSVMQTEQFFMSLAAGPDGVLYAMENSKEGIIGYDDWGWEIYGYSNTNLYAIDPIAGTVELIGDTGVKCNMLASMSYDYDTNALYWTPLYQYDSIVSGLYVVDTETAAATSLGTIGMSGAQISGLYIISENVPAENPDVMHALIATPVKTSVTVGGSVSVSATTLPMNLDAEIVWTSSNENVATVDANGVVTGVAQGKAVITATVTYNGVTMTDDIQVAVLDADAAFLTYNMSQGGWGAISRADAAVVTPLTEGEDAPAVSAITSVNDVVYGYDVENNFFTLDLTTYERTVIGAANSDELVINYLVTYFGVDETEAMELKDEFAFDVRDMDYDAANDRILVLGNVYDVAWGEMECGNGIYEVDLETGAMTLLHTFETIYNVMAIAVDEEGMVIYYNSFNDYYTRLDLTSGAEKGIVTLQTLSYYGDTESDHGLYYDALTGMIYHLFTQNGTFYRLIAVDPVSGSITLASEFVGDVYYDYEIWGYAADVYQGFTFVDFPEAAPELYANYVNASLSLDGKIGVNYYMDLSADLVADPDAYMEFTVNGEKQRVNVADATVDPDGTYKFTCYVNAKQMADTIVSQVYSYGEAIGEAKEYSVKQYCATAFAYPELVEAETISLAKAMLNYGAAAQIYFDYNVENLANAELSAEDQILPETVDVSAYSNSLTGSEEGIEVSGFSLILESDTNIKLYFKLTGDKAIEDYEFAVDGKVVAPVADDKGEYSVKITNIAAKNLDEEYTVTVGGLTATCSAMSYVKKTLNTSDASEAAVNLVKALYVYNQTANDYFG